MKAGVHVVARDDVQNALVQFLRFKPRRDHPHAARGVGRGRIALMIFVRPDEVIMPPGMPQARQRDLCARRGRDRHGLHVEARQPNGRPRSPAAAGKFQRRVVRDVLRGAVVTFASEPGGGNHLHGPSTIGKTMASDSGQSIYGWPLETADNAFGVTWAGSEAGFDALALARTDLGLPLDEITLANRRSAEQIVYKLASGTKGRARPPPGICETAHASVLVYSTRREIAGGIGKSLQEGAQAARRCSCRGAPGSAFETIRASKSTSKQAPI